ncbi:MAG TPA: ABC transporter substrate-binding protein [Candidatus Dormibacteraeota bacterium]
MRRPGLRIGACLSLTGRYARFGLQAAAALETWRRLDRDVELIIEDDASDPVRLTALIGEVASGCDLLLGPYSTQLMRAAARALAGRDRLIWNHGGSGDDVEGALPGRIVSLPAPASRYAAPFLRRLAERRDRAPLRIVRGRGSFGRQVAAGAEALARELGLGVTRSEPAGAAWDLLSAGTFEDDIAAVTHALALPRPPRTVCSVAAGVQEFARAVADPEGVLGVAQWFPGAPPSPGLGPTEAGFLAAHAGRTGAVPDYPAIQAVAGAVIAKHCAILAGSVAPDALWAAAASLDTSTLFGGFRIAPGTGVQVKHETVLVRWSAGRLRRE